MYGWVGWGVVMKRASQLINRPRDLVGEVPQRYRIFFFPEKVYPHSLTRFRTNLFFFFPGGRKKKNSRFFPILGLYFFFPRKSLKCTHSLKNLGCFFFFRPPEKKNGISTHSLKISRKVAKSKLFRGKKKYGTFG